MKKLIKEILKNYSTDFFEIKLYSYDGGILFEEIRANEREIRELGYTPTPISDEEESFIKSYLYQVNSGQNSSSKNFNQKGDGFIGIFKNRDGKTKEIKFKIKLKRHWYFRLHRTEDPKSKKYPSIIDPKPLECIELLEKNSDELAKFVTTKNPYPNVVWNVNGPNNLNFLMVFEPRDFDGTEYDLILTNQIKGVDFFDRVSKNKIPLR